ncbi:MAG: putative portal protein [Prokaryotic dsDNA virus sp.]|nr:MAG: putative portal protein [Prokaryotic dsDNA virus sp.]|tara:strand:+ start:3240 stop:5351 length:2112 start_codon:yes stop_codon:yes gene_type:complete
MAKKKAKIQDYSNKTKQNLLSIALDTQTAPIIQEVLGRDYVEYGTENYRNLYPQFLIELYYNSSTHAAIVNTTAEMIAGEGLIVEESDNLNAYVKMKKTLAHANSKGESLHSIIKKLAFDFKLQGSYALNVVWSKDRQTISEIYHVPVERIRMGKPDVTGQVKEYYISADWAQPRKHKPQAVPAFSLTDRTNPNAIIYDGMYSPSMQLYKTPDYVAACNWCLVDQKVAEFHLANIENGFAGSYFINFSNGVPTFEERRDIENSIKDKFTGSNNAGKFVLTFADDKNRTPEIVPISVSDADKQYLALQELLTQNILTGHRVTSPMLFGIKNNTGLGNNADELNQAFEVYLNSVIKPYQNTILKCLSTLFEVNDMNLPLEFIQNKPITSKWTVEDMKEVMTQDEIREELGLAPLEKTEETVEEEENEENLAKIGEIDGMPVYETAEEAIEEANKLGCEGYHEHEYEGRTVYMPCADHDQIVNMSKCECDGTTKECDKNCGKENLSKEKTPTSEEIIQYLKGLSKEDEYDLLDDYNLLDEEKAEDENHNYEFAANTGSINPSGKEGKSNKDRSLFKIRYVYRGGAPKETTRDFCRHMMNNEYTSLFTREDITAMSTANPEFGTYNLFRYKGSYNCRHYWLRRLYVLKKAPREVTIDGKVYKKGDYLPKELKNYYPRNKGYVPQDAGVPPKNSAEIEAGNINDKVVR